MKKTISTVLALILLFTVGVTAVAANPTELETGKKVSFVFDIQNAPSDIKIQDTNGYIRFDTPIVTADHVYVNVTALPGYGGRLTKIILTSADGKTEYQSLNVTIKGTAGGVTSPSQAPAGNIDSNIQPDSDGRIRVYMGGLRGITADSYNILKRTNADEIIFEGMNDSYTWTIRKGDYTKLNMTSNVYFGVTVDNRCYTLDIYDSDRDGNKEEAVLDTVTEAAVLKALGNPKANVFFVSIDYNTNIANVAPNADLKIRLPGTWIDYIRGRSVTGYKFDGEKVTKVKDSTYLRPGDYMMDLDFTSGGTYVFVDDSTPVNPAKPSTPSGSTGGNKPSGGNKPNAGTGANNAAAAVVVLAVMAAAAIGSKKIVK